MAEAVKTGIVPSAFHAGAASCFEMRMIGAWEVCTDIDFGRRCEIFDGDVAKAAPLGLTDLVSSFRPAR